MEFTRVSFILRNCLKEVPDEIILMIMDEYIKIEKHVDIGNNVFIGYPFEKVIKGLNNNVFG